MVTYILCVTINDNLDDHSRGKECFATISNALRLYSSFLFMYSLPASIKRENQ